MMPQMTDEKEFLNMYLDYVNNFVTFSRFAEYYDLTEEEAQIVLSLGRKYNLKLSGAKNEQ